MRHEIYTWLQYMQEHNVWDRLQFFSVFCATENTCTLHVKEECVRAAIVRRDV